MVGVRIKVEVGLGLGVRVGGEVVVAVLSTFYVLISFFLILLLP